MNKLQRLEKEKAKSESLEYLHRVLANVHTLYTITRHVSRSGMARTISVYAMIDNAPRDISKNVGNAIGLKWDEKHYGLKTGGIGLDLGFHIVYALGRAMFPNGAPCTGENLCHSNDHHNGDRDYTAGKIHKDAGYYFQQSWL